MTDDQINAAIAEACGWTKKVALIEMGKTLAMELFAKNWIRSVTDPVKLAEDCVKDAMKAASVIVSYKEALLKYADEQMVQVGKSEEAQG
jgi:hypothetical protein